jgi:hypothetical protein
MEKNITLFTTWIITCRCHASQVRGESVNVQQQDNGNYGKYNRYCNLTVVSTEPFPIRKGQFAGNLPEPYPPMSAIIVRLDTGRFIQPTQLSDPSAPCCSR